MVNDWSKLRKLETITENELDFRASQSEVKLRTYALL